MEAGSSEDNLVAEADHVRERVVAARPVLDPIGRAVMRSRVVGALFGRHVAVQIGRYELGREVGTGGGGSVFVGRDPELDREIAIKLIATTDDRQRARALAEGQALARLAHPNVVPVFDVGVADERVYLVMELVRGESLRRYAEHASARAVIAAYRQAGAGLVAAHAAGLVHRDFKPDNAMIGADGRVRVVDFGLVAVEGVVAAGAGGTRQYQAPEQRDPAAATTPASDQYAFAVSLREAVMRARGRARQAGRLPRWLERLVARGAAEDPTQRYPSMEMLLRELANDPRRRWTRRAVVAVPIALVVMGFAVGRRGGDGEGTTCGGGLAALAPAWSVQRAQALQDHIAGLGTPFARETAPRVRAQLDRYAVALGKARDEACVAARTEPSATLIDRRSACLAAAQLRVGAAIDVLSRVESAALADALRAVAELPEVSACANAAVLLANDDELMPAATAPEAVRRRAADLQAALVRGQVLADAASPDAVAVAGALVAEARSLAHRPLIAAALLLHGRALTAVERRQAAIAPLEEAVELAIESRDDRTAVEAFARLMLVKRVEVEPSIVLAELRPILALARRLDDHDRFVIALLHNHIGVLQLASGNPERARAAQRHALELARKVNGPGAVELAWVRSNLALVTENGDERARLNAEALEVVRTHLGPDHPLTLKLAIGAGLQLADPGAARAAAKPAFARLALLHANQGTVIVEYGYDLAMLVLAGGDRDAAREVLDAVLAVDVTEDVDSQRVAVARAYRQALAGDTTAALAELARLAIANAPAADAPWFMLVVPADIEIGRAVAATSERDRRAAAARAIAFLERAASAKSWLVDRRLAWARSLARPSP